jgi:CRP/FNR family cyclic AMP-dependent transcriptional regulator
MAVDTSEYWFFEYFDILDSLTDDQKEKVMSMSCRTNWAKNSIIYDYGDSTDKLYFLKKGSIKVSKFSEEGKEMIIGVCKKGDVFGLDSVFSDDTNRNEVVQATENVLTCALDITDVRALLNSNLEFNKAVLKLIGDRSVVIRNRLEAMFFKTSPERIKGFIKDYALEYGTKLVYSNEIEVKVPFTHEDIAKLTGTTRQTTTTVFNQLQKEEVIVYDRNRILVKDISRL